MSIILSPLPFVQIIDEDGNPVAGGYIFTYKAGTNTPLATYSDQIGTANTNPVVLDAAGRCSIWIDSGLAYKYVVKAADSTTIRTIDNINSGSTIISMTVADVADMTALTVTSATSMLVTTEGYTTANDGGGGSYFWNSTDTTAPDGGMVIAADSAPAIGRWNRLAYGFINPRWYGAKGDNSTNDTAVFTDAGSYAAAQGWFLLVDKGTYVLGSDPGLTCVVKLLPGAMLKWSGYVLPVNYDITDRTQHFVPESGATILNPNSTDIYPEWFGALGNNALTDNTVITDDTDAIQAAVNSAAAGDTIILDSSKKYFSKELTWKAGVNLRGSKPYTNDTTTSYKATLQFNDSSGSLITLGGGDIQGTTIQDLVLDGNTTSDAVLSLSANQVTVRNCTVRRSNGYGIYVYGSSNTVRPRIENNTITGCASNGIMINGTAVTDAIVSKNYISECVTGAMYIVNRKGYQITDNILDDIELVGIYVSNTTVEAPSKISGNIIRALTHASAVGIQVASTVSNYICVNGNIMFNDGTGAASCIGIQLTGPTALPGEIFDNRIVGYSTPVDISASPTTIYRDTTPTEFTLNISQIVSIAGNGWGIYTGTGSPEGVVTANIGSLYFDLDASASWRSCYTKLTDMGAATGWQQVVCTNDYFQVSDSNKYKIQMGDKTQIQTDDKEAQLVTFSDGELSDAVGSSRIISVIGGRAGATGIVGETGSSNNLWERISTYRYTGASDITGARMHNGLGFDVMEHTPRTDCTWVERDPIKKEHIWGDHNTVYGVLSDHTVSGCTGVLNIGQLNFGSGAVNISDIKTVVCNTAYEIDYVEINKHITLRLPQTSNTHFSLTPYYRNSPNNCPDTATTLTITPGLGIIVLTEASLAGKTYVAGDYVVLVGKTRTAWLGGFWWLDQWEWGVVTDYDGAGVLTVNVLVAPTYPTTITTTNVLAAWPWCINTINDRYIVPTQMDAATCLNVTPVNVTWPGLGGLSYTTISAIQLPY